MKYRIRTLSEEEFGRWDEAVLACDRGTIFHTTAWLEAGGKPFEILAVEDESRLVGGFAAQYDTGRNGHAVGRSILTPYSGQVVFQKLSKPSGEVTVQKTIAALAAQALQERFSSIRVRLSPFTTDIQPYIWAGFEAGIRYTNIVDISSLEAAWENLDENHRRNIRRMEKAGACVDTSFRAEDGIRIFRATRDSPDRWRPVVAAHDRLLSALSLCKAIGIRSRDGELLSAIYLVWDRYRSYYLLGGYREEKELRSFAQAATTYGLWEAMKFSGERLGLKEFDLEGSMIPGVELFFRKFGGKLTPYYTVTWRKTDRGAGAAIGRLKRVVTSVMGAKRGT